MIAIGTALVVGGGTAGAAAAVFLARGGIAVDLIESSPDVTALGSGIALHGNGLCRAGVPVLRRSRLLTAADVEVGHDERVAVDGVEVGQLRQGVGRARRGSGGGEADAPAAHFGVFGRGLNAPLTGPR